MQKIDSSAQLRQAILQLEQEQAAEARELKTQMHVVQESIKPVNLIKSTLQEVAGMQEVQDKIITLPLALATGYVSKKLFEGETHSTMRKVLGTALMMTVTDTINSNPEVVRNMAKGAMSLLLTAMRSAKPKQK